MTGPVPILHNGMGARQGIWEAGSDQHQTIGERASLNDGRVFYYARNSGAAIVAGNLLTVEVQTAQFTEMAVTTAAAGDTTLAITTGSTAVTANEYSEGYVFVIDGTGEGITYKIANHPAVAGTTEGTFTLRDPIHIGFAAATTVQIMKNPWADVVIAPAGFAHIAAGVSQVAVDSGATTQQYFWCQTWGMTCVWQDEICAAGLEMISGPTAGQVEIQDAVTEAVIGWNAWTSAESENAPMFLRIAP